MKEETCTVLDNKKIAKNTHLMKLSQNEENFPRPGMFFDIALPGHFLRRPFSLADHDASSFSFVYKAIGHGTEEMTKMEEGTELDILLGLGNGFDLAKSGDTPLLIGGGSGIGVMHCLAKAFIKEKKHPLVALGFNTKEEVFFEKEFEELGIKPLIYTVDGSYGEKGFPTQSLKEPHSYLYSCGPEPLLKALAEDKSKGEFSLERRMGCGYGCCMGCTIVTKNGPRRVCKEGPVFEKEDLVW